MYLAIAVFEPSGAQTCHKIKQTHQIEGFPLLTKLLSWSRIKAGSQCNKPSHLDFLWSREQ